MIARFLVNQEITLRLDNVKLASLRHFYQKLAKLTKKSVLE